MLDLENSVHNCVKCKDSLRDILCGPPIYSFGNLEGKEILVVGMIASEKEYSNNYLSNSPYVEERRKSQLTYFERLKYLPRYFKEIARFFENEVNKKVGWKHMPWEKVGYVDLVKCPARSNVGWSKINKTLRREFIRNCEGYLKEQLNLYKPQIILPYGVDVGRWFANYLNLKYEQFEDKDAQLNNTRVHVLFIPQRQGPHSKPEIRWVRRKILNAFK